MESNVRRGATTVYPSREGAFPAATFLTSGAEFAYVRHVQSEYTGTFGICVCPAGSFWMHQVDVLPMDKTNGL